MKKVGTMLVAALLVLAFSGHSTTYAQGAANQITIQLNEQNGSGESGTATLMEVNGQVMVKVDLANAPAGVAQPAHIHKGTCANLDPTPKYPLTSVTDGTSQTTVAVTLADLTSSGQAYAINVHKSAAEAKIYVACGDIVNMQMGGASGGTTTGGTTTGGTTTGGTTGGTTTGGTTTPGMPATGAGDQALPLFAFMLAALAFLATGLKVRLASIKK